MVQFQSGVGRLVWGKPGVMTAKKGDDGKPLLGDDNKPQMELAFGVAFPKPEFMQLMAPKIMEALGPVFPNGAPANFAWKYVDGDAATGHTQGKPFNQRTGYPGCFVMTFKTNFAIPLFRPSITQPGAWDQIGPNDIKTGDYIAVSGDFNAHPAKNARAVPGLYTNPQGVLLIGVGEAIMNAPDAAQMFGGGMTYTLPPGATAPGAAPAMPGGMATPPGMPGAAVPTGYPAPGQMQPQQQMPGVQYSQQPQQMPAPGAYPGGPVPGAPASYPPAHDFVQQAMPGYAPQPAPGLAPGFTQPGAMPGQSTTYAPQPVQMGMPGAAPTQPGYASVPGTPATGYPSNPGQMPGFPPR